MSGENKFFAGIGIATVILIIGGVFFLSRQSSNQNLPEGGQQIDLVSDGKFATGSAQAKVKVIEFGDYQCPACAVVHPIVKEILAKNIDKIYFDFRNFPLSSIHNNALDSASAAEAAGEQGKFWEMHDMLYERQKDWEKLADPRGKFKEYAQGLELDMKKYEEDLGKFNSFISDETKLGERAGVDSTPTFFINGQKISGVIPADKFQQLIDDASK